MARPSKTLEQTTFCNSCKTQKEITDFAKDNRAKTGYQSRCKDCAKLYYIKNRDHYRKLKQKESYKKKVKEYQIKNKDLINEYKRKRYSSEDGKAKVKALNSERRALKRTTSDGSVTSKFIKELMIKQNYKCALSGVCIKHDYHIDHIIPLSKGGKHTKSNIQLLNPSVNMSKKDSIL